MHRRRFGAAALVLLTACGVGTGDASPSTTDALTAEVLGQAVISTTTATVADTAAPTTTSTIATTTTTTPTTTTTLIPTTDLSLEEVGQIVGDISPKSVVATGNGLFFAQNMMYRHTITVYDRNLELVTTIPDTVDLRPFGFEGESYQGSPVEAAVTADGSHAYVSNYQMYGPGFGRPGDDDCGVAEWDESFVYRVSTETFEIDQIIAVGAVPKFLAITPDDRRLLVTNWCSHDLSVVDIEAGEELIRLPLGRHPRGIAVTSDGGTAYVAVMGSADIAVVDLSGFEVGWLQGVGANPRHLVMDPGDRYLYATLNGEGRVAKIDLASGEVITKIETGIAPRSMTISDDGRSLYVVNYASDTVAKVDAERMEVSQVLDVPHHPIGIAFDPGTRQVWVASYSGAITVLAER